jgi:putative colanic acid biosysnthesis UDP-glucose lipid carrier transferase
MNSPKRIGPKAIAIGTLPTQERSGWTISHLLIAPLAMVLDVALIGIACVVSTVAYDLETMGRVADLESYIGLASVTAVLFLALGKNSGTYDLSELLNLKLQIRRIAARWSAVLLFLTAAAFAMKVGSAFSRGATISFGLIGISLLICSRVGWRLFLANGVRRFSSRQVAIIADRASATEAGIFEALARHGLQPVHHFLLPSTRASLEERRSTIARAISAIRGSTAEEIVVCTTLDNWTFLKQVVAEFRILPLPVSLVPVGEGTDLFNLPHRTIGDTITIELQSAPRTPIQRAIKRIFDVLISASCLILLFPLFLMTAAAIKLDSPGRIVFRQRRCGFNGRLFEIFKFRTMTVLEDGNHVAQAKRNDNRITKIGSLLRRTSVDELPQLFNVLRGDMSIIGPRPHALVHDDEFMRVVANYAFRHHVKPGITGWAQVNGCRGETKTLADIERRLELDLFYIDNWNLALDFKIIFMTMIEIIRGKNAY